MNRCARLAVAALLVVITFAPAARAESVEHVEWSHRGKTLSLAIYRPAGVQSGTVFMAGGDVGWVGLAVTMAHHLAAQGYLVVGINVRQYLSAYTVGSAHLSPADIQRDYADLSQYLNSKGLLKRPVIVSGVSEGAALAVVAAAAPENHSWISGAITMGLPAIAEIAWRWSDFTTWITKKDAAEPSVRARDYLASVSPVPLVMIQSTRDEYVPSTDYRDLENAARAPHQQVLIDASNHRFTDKIPELQKTYNSALAWISSTAELTTAR
jgi:type IV secretory pathway VirJ component